MFKNPEKNRQLAPLETINEYNIIGTSSQGLIRAILLPRNVWFKFHARHYKHYVIVLLPNISRHYQSIKRFYICLIYILYIILK